jgi:hypothetical protein
MAGLGRGHHARTLPAGRNLPPPQTANGHAVQEPVGSWWGRFGGGNAPSKAPRPASPHDQTASAQGEHDAA